MTQPTVPDTLALLQWAETQAAWPKNNATAGRSPKRAILVIECETGDSTVPYVAVIGTKGVNPDNAQTLLAYGLATVRVNRESEPTE